jgi:hypothetical protein
VNRGRRERIGKEEIDGARLEESQAKEFPAFVGKLAVLSGAFFGLLGLLCWTGGFSGPALVFFSIYVLCAVQCALRFRSKIMNVFFLLALVLYLSGSFLFAFELFDYHLFIMTCGLFALSAASIEKQRYGGLLCGFLAACAVVAGILTVRSVYGIHEGTYHAYVAGSVAVPFLLLLAALAGAALAKNKKNASLTNYAAACLLALQLFPLVAFVLYVLQNAAFLRGVSSSADTLFYIASANALRALPNQFLWQTIWRFAGMAVQLLAFASFFVLALAHMLPDIFTCIFDKGNRGKFSLATTSFTAVIAVLTKAVSLIK